MSINVERLIELVQRFRDCKVGVAGDLIADVYQFGTPVRLSREAPVMVVKCGAEKVVPGSAANSALNLASLCGKVSLVGLLGNDDAGVGVLRTLVAAGIDERGIIRRDDWATVSKTRIMVGEAGRTPQQLIRLDHEPDDGVPDEVSGRVLEWVGALDCEVDSWLVSDYEYGLISPLVADHFVKDICSRKPVVVDSRHNLNRFQGVEAICPNRDEAEQLVGHSFKNRGDIIAGGHEIVSRLNPAVLFLTLGNEGMGIFTRSGKKSFLPVVGPDGVTDVSGAGDTVAATILLARCVGADQLEAGLLATCAASVVVQKLGAATVTPAELIRTLGEAAPQLANIDFLPGKGDSR